MGILSFLDKVDEAVCTARASRGAQREAKKFADSVKPGRTYWSVVTCHTYLGKTKHLQEWQFGPKRHPITGAYMSGHLSAAGAWLSYGPIHAHRPAGLRTLQEMKNDPEFPPEIVGASIRIEPAGV